MILSRLLLQNFRSYDSANFTFSPHVTFIIGPNTAGKSNLIEAIYLLSYGKSFRAERDEQMVQFSSAITRVKGKIEHASGESQVLEVMLAEGSLTGKSGLTKKYQINDLPKRRSDFAGTMKALLFDPTDLDIIAGSPGLRREFLDEVLEQTDREYRHALLTYTRALRQRNALLHHTKETGIRNEKQFTYWDELLITAGTEIHTKRNTFIDWINIQQKELFSFFIVYDHSVISEERLLQYKDAEVGAGVTLVGPHRDDFKVFMGKLEENKDNAIEVKSFGSRGQQRLAVVQLKLLQLQYMRETLQEQPLLLLDDIFSELDDKHIRHVLQVAKHQQTIITTTHKEFVEDSAIDSAKMIELGGKDIRG